MFSALSTGAPLNLRENKGKTYMREIQSEAVRTRCGPQKRLLTRSVASHLDYLEKFQVWVSILQCGQLVYLYIKLADPNLVQFLQIN